jgi:hypothetical protein
MLARGKRTEILRAAATRENDKRGIRQDQNRHYSKQDSIVARGFARSADAEFEAQPPFAYAG